MKNIIIILFALISFSSYAQSSEKYIDVVHLKNGKEVKGVILEQKIGESIKIRTLDGTESVYTILEIDKLEKKLQPEPKWMTNFKPKDNGWFIEAEGILSFVNTSRGFFNITNGYKFNRFAYLGLGIGVGFQKEEYYFYRVEPVVELNLSFSGDILEKRLTPYYQLTGGFSFLQSNGGDIIVHQQNGNFDDPNYSYTGREVDDFGGPYGEIGFGIRIKSLKKIYYKFGVDMRIGANLNSSQLVYFDNNEGFLYLTEGLKNWNSYGSFQIRFGIGF